MADPAKYKSLSVPREDWEQLGVLATKTNRTRSKMIGRLIRFFMDNKGAKEKWEKIKIAKHACICPECGNGYNKASTDMHCNNVLINVKSEGNYNVNKSLH